MKKTKLGLVSILLLAFAGQVNATLMLTAADADWTAYDPPPVNNLSAAVISAIVGSTVDTLLYEKDGSESGSLAGSYSGSFTDSTITLQYDSGTAATCPLCVLVIKDGANRPNFYLFDLGSWDGMEEVQISGLWAGVGGSVSNFRLWGGEGGESETQVPEPGSLTLLGAGLLALGFIRLKRAS